MFTSAPARVSRHERATARPILEQRCQSVNGMQSGGTHINATRIMAHRSFVQDQHLSGKVDIGTNTRRDDEADAPHLRHKSLLAAVLVDPLVQPLEPPIHVFVHPAVEFGSHRIQLCLLIGRQNTSDLMNHLCPKYDHFFVQLG